MLLHHSIIVEILQEFNEKKLLLHEKELLLPNSKDDLRYKENVNNGNFMMKDDGSIVLIDLEKAQKDKAAVNLEKDKWKHARFVPNKDDWGVDEEEEKTFREMVLGDKNQKPPSSRRGEKVWSHSQTKNQNGESTCGVRLRLLPLLRP